MAKIQFNDDAIYAIQKYRDGGDVQLCIEFVFTVLQKEPLQLIDNCTTWSVEGTKSLRGEIQFNIAKSLWVEQMLPGLGYKGFKLFEIPITHNLIKEAYGDIIAEFNNAQNYFNDSDYNKCISHCRHTLDHLSRNLKK